MEDADVLMTSLRQGTNVPVRDVVVPSLKDGGKTKIIHRPPEPVICVSWQTTLSNY